MVALHWPCQGWFNIASLWQKLVERVFNFDFSDCVCLFINTNELTASEIFATFFIRHFALPYIVTMPESQLQTKI